jgi:carbon-monoxide dehydrogenase large subunit
VPPLIGSRLRRLEDPRLITGAGRYAGDVALPGLVHLAVFRSSLAQARITALDLGEARAIPGVLAAWTVEDLPEGARTFDEFAPRHVTRHPRPVLASGTAHCVGDALAAVVAETAYAAADATQAIFADLQELPAAGTLEAALADGAARVHEDLESNLAGEAALGYGDVEEAFAATDTVIASARLAASRICGSAMEPRSVTATYDQDTGELTIWTSTQSVFGVRDTVAGMLGLEQEKVRVLAEDVGGGFGPKAAVYPEEVLVAFATLQLGRPVRWTATRSEDTTTTVQGHGSIFELELAAGPDGRLRALRGRFTHDLGAYTGSGAGQADIIVPHMMSAYVLPALRIQVRLVHTNSVPAGFVRGGGRPLGNFAMERMMDRLAVALGMDPAELRRRNLVQPNQMPYDTGYPAGRRTQVYDGGDYPKLLELALEAIDYQSLDRTASNGRLVGVGLACCVESSGFGRNEPARVRLEKDGLARLFVGSSPQGQSHATMAAQVLVDRLGWPLERVKVVAGDTSVVGRAEMTAGSRTAVQVGNAVSRAASSTRRLLLERAGEVLEADLADLQLKDGVVSVRGAPARSLPAADLVPEEGLEVSETFTPDRPLAYSSGCHAAVVEVDPTTGSVEVKRYVIVHDTGRSINEMVVEGQIQGGFAHGVGYALFEEAIYLQEGGFLSASFLDYSIPGAPEVTVPTVLHIETPTDANPEGFKGAGESGTIPAPAALSNAIEDALRQARPDVLVGEIPITPNRIFDLLQPS